VFGCDDAWVWDFWVADDGRLYHLFFLVAPSSLGDPEARHRNAAVGHAVSTDLRHWSRRDDVVGRGAPGQFDSLATWTGCTVRRSDGTWFLFYTGAAQTGRGLAQSIGCATSPDLGTWTKHPGNPVLVPDGHHYPALDAAGHPAAFRDPWVFPDPDGAGWHMILTGAGVVGHAWSPDLVSWQARPALSDPGQGFGVLEVPQVEVVDGRPVLLFSCPPDETTAPVVAANPRGGVWAAPAPSLLGPYPVSGARQLVDDGLYSGRLVRDRGEDRWVFLAFDRDVDSPTFLQISDPLPIGWRDGVLAVGAAPPAPPVAGTSDPSC
jgi:beta-fructofuranosidase